MGKGSTTQELIPTANNDVSHGVWIHTPEYTHLTRQGEAMVVECVEWRSESNYLIHINAAPQGDTLSHEWARQAGYRIASEMLRRDPENIDYEYIEHNAANGSDQAQGSMAAIHEFYAFKRSTQRRIAPLSDPYNKRPF